MPSVLRELVCEKSSNIPPTLVKKVNDENENTHDGLRRF